MESLNTKHCERYLTTSEVADITGFAEQTLTNHRFRGIGIPYTKLNRSVRYAMSDVVNFMQSKRIDPEAA